MMSSGDVRVRKRRIVDCKGAKFVWRLECPFCGWLFGFCLDLSGMPIENDAVFLLDGIERIPTRFPKRESGHTFAYFKVRRRKCSQCGAIMIPEDDLDDWLMSRGIEPSNYDEIEDLLLRNDPNGILGKTCSDRVYDAQFEEWGTDGMPSRYLAIRESSSAQRRLMALFRSRV